MSYLRTWQNSQDLVGNKKMTLRWLLFKDQKVMEYLKLLLNLPVRRLDQLKTAVAEATMNAMEHGNHYLPDRPVYIKVLASQAALSVRITDHGGTRILPSESGIEVPDIEAKLAELQTPRGWGLFLIKHMVDEMNISSDASHHTVELIMYLKGEDNASEKS